MARNTKRTQQHDDDERMTEIEQLRWGLRCALTMIDELQARLKVVEQAAHPCERGKPGDCFVRPDFDTGELGGYCSEACAELSFREETMRNYLTVIDQLGDD